MDLIKQKKLKLFGHICRMEDQQLTKTVMLEIVYSKEIGLVEDSQKDGPTTSRTGVDVYCRSLYNWRTTDNSGDESLASKAHMDHEFQRKGITSLLQC